jgi:hypothetical protein
MNFEIIKNDVENKISALTNLKDCSFITLIQLNCYGEQQTRNPNSSVHREWICALPLIQQQLSLIKNLGHEPIIEVYYEEGYRWSVHVDGEEESRDTNITKAEAMRLARSIKRTEFNMRASISAQKLSKLEKASNIKHLHSTSETYFNAYQYSS